MGKWKGRDEANTGILGAWLTAHTQGSYMLLLKIEPSPSDGVVSLLIFYACVIIPTAMIVAEKKNAIQVILLFWRGLCSLEMWSCLKEVYRNELFWKNFQITRTVFFHNMHFSWTLLKIPCISPLTCSQLKAQSTFNPHQKYSYTILLLFTRRHFEWLLTIAVNYSESILFLEYFLHFLEIMELHTSLDILPFAFASEAPAWCPVHSSASTNPVWRTKWTQGLCLPDFLSHSFDTSPDVRLATL